MVVEVRLRCANDAPEMRSNHTLPLPNPSPHTSSRRCDASAKRLRQNLRSNPGSTRGHKTHWKMHAHPSHSYLPVTTSHLPEFQFHTPHLPLMRLPPNRAKLGMCSFSKSDCTLFISPRNAHRSLPLRKRHLTSPALPKTINNQGWPLHSPHANRIGALKTRWRVLRAPRRTGLNRSDHCHGPSKGTHA